MTEKTRIKKEIISGVTRIDEKHVSIKFDHDRIFDYVVNYYEDILPLVQKVVQVDAELLENTVFEMYYQYLAFLAETDFDPALTIEKAMDLKTFFEFFIESSARVTHEYGLHEYFVQKKD